MDPDQIIISYSVKDIAKVFDLAGGEQPPMLWEDLTEENKIFVCEVCKNALYQQLNSLNMRDVIMTALKQIRLKIIKQLNDLKDESEPR